MSGADPALPFTRLEGASPGSAWWSWILELDPFAPATVDAGAVPASERARQAARAGYVGESATACRLASDPDPGVRAVALGALARLGELGVERLSAALRDPDPEVRRRACELAASRDDLEESELSARLGDRAEVAEMAAWALGERAAAGAVPALSDMARGHREPLCREAAVAALGAIGDHAGLAAILAALEDKPAVRRRAVLALAPFEGREVEAALERARSDRDWQVRQAAEDLAAP